MKTYLKPTTRIVLFTACMGGLAACSGDDSKGNLKEGIVKEISGFAGVAKVTQIARTIDGVPVTGKFMASDAAAKEFMKRSLTGTVASDKASTVASDKVQLAETFKKTDNARFEADDTVEGGTLYSGTANVNGFSTYYHIYESKTAPVIAGRLYESNLLLTTDGGLTLGEKASKLPTGKHTYSGYNNIIRRNNTHGSSRMGGKFDMTVDFSKKLITKFDATTYSSLVKGKDIPVNLAHGTFKGDITASGKFVNDETLSGEVYGDFHGVGATGVSGMYDANQADPEYHIDGFFAGSKQ